MFVSDTTAHYLHLLTATLKHAFANTEYYSRLLSDRDLDLSNLDSFSDIPILTRATIYERSEELISTEEIPDFLRNTSGTTFGSLSRNPLVTYHTHSERLLWEQLMAIDAQEKIATKPLMLRLLSLDHGLDVTSGGKGVFAVALEKKAHFAHICDLLTKNFNFKGFSNRIHGISGSLTRLKLLTLLCINNGFKRSNFNIEFIACHSQLLTNRWREIFVSYWGIAPVEFYGLSEIPGLIGSRCDSCNYYHLSPVAYIEMVNPDTYKPVNSGLARIIATGLYPLIKTQPLIRYDTEDIVEIMPVQCPITYQYSIEYVGRSNDVIWSRDINGETVLLLSPMRLHEIIDEESEINIDPNQRAMNFGINDFGFHKYNFNQKIEQDKVLIRVNIELRWNPIQFPDQANEIEKRIYKKLLKVSNELSDAIDKGIAHLSVISHPPGTLTNVSEA